MKYLILTGDYIDLRKGQNCYEQEKMNKCSNSMFACMLDCQEDSDPSWLEDACAIEKPCKVKTVLTNNFVVCRMY